MNDLTILLPSKGENPHYARQIIDYAGCPVLVVNDMLYGEAIKTGVRMADTTYILTMDADGQHTLHEAMKLYSVFTTLDVDLLIGERRQKDRNLLRVLGSTFLNILASFFAGKWVHDLNSGMRIFKRENALSYEQILCDDFSYTTSTTMCHLSDNLKVEWCPINVRDRQEGQSSVKWFKHTLISLYFIFYIGIGLKTREVREWLRSHR